MHHRVVLARTSFEVGLWIGMLGGGVELMVSAYRRWVLDRLLFVGSDYWWLTVLLAGTIVGVANILATAVVPRRLATAVQRVRFAVPFILASLGVLWMFHWLAPAAAFVLAIGVGSSGGSWLALRAGRVDRVVRRSLPVMGLAPLLFGVGLHLDTSRWTSSRRAPENLSAPNVLLLVLDTVRAIELGLYGFTPSTSPALDGLGAAGVVFDQAYSTAPWSAPSHASLFTGRNPTELSIDWDRPLDATYPTLAEELGRAGYSTVGIVANTAYASAETGLGRGFDRYEDYRLTLRRALAMPSLTRRILDRKREWLHEPPLDGAGRIPAQSVSRRLLSWLERRPQQPYFAFLNFYDAHAPYSAPEPFWSRFLPGETRRAIPIRTARRGDPTEGPARKAYDAAISHLDSEIGALLDSMLQRGFLNNTLVVVTADHGEEFNEHAALGHGQTLHTQALRVPLLLFWPGHLPSARVTAPVSLARLPATIMDLVSRPGPFPGPSLVPLWRGEPSPQVAAISTVTFAPLRNGRSTEARKSLASVQVGRFHYIQYPGDSLGRLYDHATDPLEMRNLVWTHLADDVVGPLRDSLRIATSAARAGKGGHDDN
jgi:arylsulfatase A-like enzyme